MSQSLSQSAQAMLLHFLTTRDEIREGRWPPRVCIDARAKLALEELRRSGLVSHAQHANGTAEWAMTGDGAAERKKIIEQSHWRDCIAYVSRDCILTILPVKGEAA